MVKFLIFINLDRCTWEGLITDIGNLSKTLSKIFSRMFWEDENEFSEIDRETNAPIFHIAQDYIIWHTSST